jgi:hypothetical protein
MPNLPMHIYLARQTAEALDWGYVQDYLGSCYLGSTAPDIRAMTRWDRERTHFAPLSVQDLGTGVRRMFELYPELADARRQSPASRAFILGYISHLVADEVWITTMYRPHFGAGNRITGTEVEAHIWDRALQLDMDRRVFGADGVISDAVNVIPSADDSVSLQFLEQAVLQEWRDWVIRFLGWDFSWERLKRALNRMYRDNDEVQQVVDRFLENLPASLERIYEEIPRRQVEAYQQRVLDESLIQVREYLSEA